MYKKILGYVLMYFIFSMIGWTVESTYRSIGETVTEKRGWRHLKIINSGFNNGPICPIYGAGVLVFEILLVPLNKHWWAVLLLGIVAADAVEYFTSFTMEKLFHARWWDYSNEFMNLHGRICLKHSIYWAVAAGIYVYLVSPLYHHLILFIPENYREILTYVILGVFLVDFTMTVIAALDIKRVMMKLETLRINVGMAGAFMKNAAGEFRGKALSRYDEFRETVITNKESAEKWFSDMAKAFHSTEKDLTDLESEEKSESHGKHSQKIYRISTLSERTEKSFNELKEKWEEIKSKLGTKNDKSA